MPRYPDFYCIGSQRAGTTWLYRCLRWHPQVQVSPVKEVHYFDSIYLDDIHRHIHLRHQALARAYFEREEELRESRGVWRLLLRTPKQWRRAQRMRFWLDHADQTIDDEWFARLFEGVPRSRVLFEVTPAYAALPPEGVEHVRRLSPNARILFIARDPIERAYSHAMLLLTKRGEPLTDDNVLAKAARGSVLTREPYGEIIDRWCAVFPRDRVRVAFYDHLRQRPYDFLRRICDFVGVRYSPVYFPFAWRPVNVGNWAPMSARVRAALAERCRPVVEDMKARFPEETRSWEQET